VRCNIVVLQVVATCCKPNLLWLVFDMCLCVSVQADQKRAKFFQAEGDHITLLAVYEAWKANKFSNPWCHENFIQVGPAGQMLRLLCSVEPQTGSSTALVAPGLSPS
jgi:hypothetical protein